MEDAALAMGRFIEADRRLIEALGVLRHNAARTDSRS
jgi:hypothetical protein